MKIYCISDTHGQKFDHLIPECDILVHAGDICPNTDHSFYYQQNWVHNTFLPSLQNIKAKHIVFIAGNHDFYFQEIMKAPNKEQIFKQNLPNNIHYLRDSGCEINGVKFWGTPWVINLPFWAFSKSESNDENYSHRDESEFLSEVYGKIPKDVDFLISHGPAYGFCDQILEHNMTNHLGSKSLLNAIMFSQPKYVISGHIHSANHNGEVIVHPGKQTNLFCTSVLDEKYKLGKYQPKMIEI